MTETQPDEAPVTVQNFYQAQANTLFVVAVVGALSFPGALVGAVLVAALWHATSAPLGRRAVFAVLGVVTALTFRTLVPASFCRSLFALITSGSLAVSPDKLVSSTATEALLGPMLVLVLQIAGNLRARTALGQVADEHRRMNTRAKAMRLGYQGATMNPTQAGDWGHPPGKIRLGRSESQRVFDLDIAEIVQHVLLAGATGTGKTTTLMRLACGAVVNGYGVIIIDCKGSGLAPQQAGQLAQEFGLPFNVVDPADPNSLGYDPCTGDAPHVANKLIGAFSFSPESEIYKNVAMEVVPVIARALAASGQPVTLERIYAVLGKGGLARLGRTPGAEAFRERLESLEAGGGVGSAGYIGLQRRFGALLEGRFGDLFAKKPAIDWATVTASPSITYFSLSATAASEDVELFGRVITQDLKQLADSRMRALRTGATLTPFLVIYDEFASLREARQIVDLLLQAREARMPVVVATQYLPEDIPIKTPVLQSGLIISHRIASEDAQVIGAEMGTHKKQELTRRMDFETGESTVGTLASGAAYNIHPDTLRALPIGMAAVYARRSNRRELVRIHLDQH